MLNVVELDIDPKDSDRLGKTIRPITESTQLAHFIDVPPYWLMAAQVIEWSYRHGSAIVEDILGTDLTEHIKVFGQGHADILLIKGLPWDEKYQNYSAQTHTGAPLTEFLYFGIARMLGALKANDLRLSYVHDGFDDNLHQDGAYLGPAYNYISYKQADFLALTCLSPGERLEIATLFMDFDSVVKSLPTHIVGALEKNSFVPKQGTAFRPLIIKLGKQWILNPEFSTHNPFAAGLMSSDEMMVRNLEAKTALDEIKKIYPCEPDIMYQVHWEPGTMAIVNQSRVYHRRHAPVGVTSNTRLLARAHIFKSLWKPLVHQQALEELSLQKLEESSLKNLPEYIRFMRWLRRQPDYQRDYEFQKSKVAAWYSEVPQFDRNASVEHRVVDRPPTLEERRTARIQQILHLP